MMPPSIPHSMRDPQGSLECYDDYFALRNGIADDMRTLLLTAPMAVQLRVRISNCWDYRKDVVHEYGRGYPLEALVESVASHLALLVEESAFVRQHAIEVDTRLADMRPVNGIWRLDFQFAALCFLLIDSPAVLQFQQLISRRNKDAGYLFDLLVKSFLPDFALADKYLPDKYSAPWTHPITTVLSLPAASRPAAMHSHMKNWQRLMRTYGWKPNLMPRIGHDRLFCDFAFEVALAVCAYDIDDCSFRDHPYYPRDLVDHYRQNLRYHRDGWRAKGVGAGVAVIAPPPPKRADLARSKRRGFARWVELVSDGNIDATEAVLEQLGKLRKVKDIGSLSCALAENDVGVHADIKDDETLELQLADLGTARGLGEFAAPTEPPAGPARCQVLLPAADAWLKPHGYCLLPLAGDEWQAVIIRGDYLDEFLALSQKLGIQFQLSSLSNFEFRSEPT